MTLKIDPATIPTQPRAQATQANAHDFAQFAALRRGAGAQDPDTLREVARQFESIFTKMMLQSMRDASFGDPMFGSDQGDMYQGMMDDQLAVQLSAGRGLGLADMLIRQLGNGATPGPRVAGEPQPDRTTGAVSLEQKRRFLEEITPHAEAAARELGVDARAIVAQAALETGWGSSQPGGAQGPSHNYFGIKTGASWRGAGVSADTTEFVDGVARGERAEFRAYGSVAENVADYVRVLRQPRYAAALGTGSDVRAFADALQRGGYATDPDYAGKLVAVASQLTADDSAAGKARLSLAADVSSFKSAADEPIPMARLNNG
jgi:flagellar protein FlgJ